jgi:hypothetical protein
MAGVYGLAADQILTHTYTTQPASAPGTVIVASNGNKYRMVYNYSATTSISQYSGCYLYSASYNSWAVAPTVASGLGTRLAVGIAGTLIGTYHYGWVCIDGVCTGYSTASVETAGFPLQPSGTGGLSVSTGADAAGNLAAQGAIFARAINTNAAAGTLLVQVYNGI